VVVFISVAGPTLVMGSWTGSDEKILNMVKMK